MGSEKAVGNDFADAIIAGWDAIQKGRNQRSDAKTFGGDLSSASVGKMLKELDEERKLFTREYEQRPASDYTFSAEQEEQRRKAADIRAHARSFPFSGALT